MIQLFPPNLPAITENQLAAYQTAVLNTGNYTAQVAEAKRRFKQYNVGTNPTFREVRARLAEMCSGPRRCNYCENSVADAVEHMAPKDLYPERTFRWENYCYACRPCNGPKKNKYAVFRDDAPDTLYKIPPHPRAIGNQPRYLIPPPAGRDALIDPRRENPLNDLLLDITDSFLFVPFADDPLSISYQRASYTIWVLSLNTRADLVKARHNAYKNFRARLREYIHDRDAGQPDSHLEQLRYNLRDESHQTVWQEMKRQQAVVPKLSPLFAAAPETLIW